MQRVRVLITLLGNNYPPKLHSKLSNYHFTRRMISDQSASLTSSRYPSLIRGNYAQVGEDDITHFKRILKDPLNVITDPQDLVGYNIDWMKIFRGCSQVVLRPKTTEDVSQILKYCNERRLAVVPQGGNTGLVGGGVPVFDEIIISTQLMNKVIKFDKDAGVLVCQAGCVLDSLNDYLSEYGMIMPLDLGAKGSCHIGGNISTNAGGMRLLRYGSLHGSVLGIEAVKADGQLLDCLSTVRKDNVGYHMKHWFIGSEGTLGVVTAVAILCPRRPASVNVAFLGCESFEKILKILNVAREQLNEILSAFEFMDRDAISCSERYLKSKNPLKDSPFYVLVETSGSNERHDEEKLNAFIENVMASGLVTDGTVSTEPSKIKDLWQYRELVSTGLLLDGHCYKYDISLPLSKYYEIVSIMKRKLSGLATTVCGYGHVGDGNLHFNATSRVFDERVVKTIEPFLYDYVAENRGSISAEHGIGFFKRDHLHYGRTPAVIDAMKQLKRMMDPNGILNPYKCLPR